MTLTTNGSVDEGKMKEVSLKLGIEIIASKSNDEKKVEYQIKFSESETNLRKVLDQNF